MRKIELFLTTLLSLLAISLSLLVAWARAQVPPPYVSCDEVRPDLLHPGTEEFHSLRPYQASPCNLQVQETARFCANRLVLTDSVGAVQAVPPPLASNCSQLQNGNYKCNYQTKKTTKYVIDLSQAQLPILGNTENVINSKQQSQDLNDAEKTNEYVSWYLNGVSGRAEYPYLSDSEEDMRKLVDFSGPIKKLLPFDIQNTLRANTVKKAVASKSSDAGLRHDEVVGCTYGINILGKEIGGIPAPCYESGLKSLLPHQEHRLSEWNKHIPPKSSDFDNFQDYWQRYEQWRGKVCLAVEIPGSIPLVGGQKILLCGIENPFSPNYYSNMYSYIPFSSTEDRVGQAEVDSKSVTPVSEGLEIDNVNLVTTPAELYFAHTEEVSDLAGILQMTFVPQGNTTTGFPSQVSPTQACDLTNIRTNPGDNLFAESIEGTLTYDAKFSCEFEATDTEASCEKEVSVGLGVVTQTPKADELWSRLVAGPSAIFKRIFPKVGPGGPILGLLDIPAATKVTYSGSGLVTAVNPGARSGESAELYFPHIGGISEYFLKGIQTILRPKGYGEPIQSGSPAPPGAGPGVCGAAQVPQHEGPGPVSGGSCQPALAGWCSPATLIRYGWPADAAEKASIICNMESGGFTNAFNDGCLCGKTADYSIGLFQVNLLYHCADDSFTHTLVPPSCTPLNQSKIDECAAAYFDPAENIAYAIQLYKQSGWKPWSTATKCGIQ